MSEKITKEKIMEALKSVYDPEIGLDIVNLGLVYDVKIGDDGVVEIKMTLTTPHCPLGNSVQEAVKTVVESLDGVKEAKVELVWDPPWNPSMMSDEAKKILGFE